MRDQKRANDYSDRELNELAIRDYMAIHPEIGILCRKGKNVYYRVTDSNSCTIIEAKDPRTL